MTAATDPKAVREIAREAIERAARRRDYIGPAITDHDVMGEILASGDRSAWGRWNEAVRAEMETATVIVSWPDEQPQDERDATVPDNLWWPFTGGMDTCFSEHDGEYRECCWRAGLAYVLKLHEQQVRASATAEQYGGVRTVAIGERYTLGHGGAYCHSCHKPMREGTPVVRVTAAQCTDCADLKARDTKGGE